VAAGGDRQDTRREGKWNTCSIYIGVIVVLQWCYSGAIVKTLDGKVSGTLVAYILVL
jgi:hypothetical protein